MAPQLVEISFPADSLQLEKRRVKVTFAKAAGPLCPGLDFWPIPRRLAGHGPAGLRHELTVTPRVDGLGLHAEARRDLRRTHGK